MNVSSRSNLYPLDGDTKHLQESSWLKSQLITLSVQQNSNYFQATVSNRRLSFRSVLMHGANGVITKSGPCANTPAKLCVYKQTQKSPPAINSAQTPRSLQIDQLDTSPRSLQIYQPGKIKMPKESRILRAATRTTSTFRAAL